MIYTDICNVVYPVGRITQHGISLLGTAVVLNAPGILATAAHVVNHDDNRLVVITNQIESIQEYQDASNLEVQCIPARIIEDNPICDVCLLKIEASISSRLSISSTDRIKVGETISIFGYPHSDHGRMVLTQQNTSVGAKVLIPSSGLKVKNIILNIQSRPGQSGSPIIKSEDMSLIGIMIGSYAPQNTGRVIVGGIDPQTLHQTTHAVSAEYIGEMLDEYVSRKNV